MRPLYRARHPGYSGDDAGGHSRKLRARPVVSLGSGFNQLPRKIINDQSTRWTATGINLHPRTLVGVPREGSAWDRLFESPVTWAHFERRSERAAESEPETPDLDHGESFGGHYHVVITVTYGRYQIAATGLIVSSRNGKGDNPEWSKSASENCMA